MVFAQVPLARRETVAEGTVAFHFTRPAGFAHRAGQSMLLTLIHPDETDGEGDSRTFTIASSPHERDLMIATRMRDTAFKRVMNKAPLGTMVKLDGPNGEMVLHDDISRPAVFLAGGIGITPFRAIVGDAAHRKLRHRLHLFYSNRRPEDAAFLNELQQLEDVNENYRLVATFTEAQKTQQTWSGETGPINAEMLARHLSDLIGPIYYFAGPPAMTAAMQRMLEDIGIDNRSMRYEEFYGY
jgi:ferredoxin-NADP reductase